jgi:hypothetical protein
MAEHPGPTKQLGSRIPVELHKRAQHAALDLDLTLEQFVAQAIEERVAKFEAERGSAIGAASTPKRRRTTK